MWGEGGTGPPIFLIIEFFLKFTCRKLYLKTAATPHPLFWEHVKYYRLNNKNYFKHYPPPPKLGLGCWELS